VSITAPMFFFMVFMLSPNRFTSSPWATSFQQLFYCCMSVCCDNHMMATEPQPSNSCLCWLHNSGFHQSCHSILQIHPHQPLPELCSHHHPSNKHAYIPPWKTQPELCATIIA
jgi:hypothetical protein